MVLNSQNDHLKGILVNFLASVCTFKDKTEVYVDCSGDKTKKAPFLSVGVVAADGAIKVSKGCCNRVHSDLIPRENAVAAPIDGTKQHPLPTVVSELNLGANDCGLAGKVCLFEQHSVLYATYFMSTEAGVKFASKKLKNIT